MCGHSQIKSSKSVGWLLLLLFELLNYFHVYKTRVCMRLLLLNSSFSLFAYFCRKKETCKSDIQSCWIERLVTEGGHILCTQLLATTYTSHSSFFSFPLLFLKVLSLLFHFPLSPHHHKRYRRRCRRQIILYFHSSSRDGTWLFHYSTNSFHSLKLFCRAKLKWIALPWAKKSIKIFLLNLWAV